jgi:hypothetical protein
LEFLTNVGLAEKRGTEYFPGQKHIFLGTDSPLIIQHHTNWRTQSIAALDPSNHDHLHYSAVVSIAKEDFEKLKSQFTRGIELARKAWTEAKKEEELCVLALDWYRLEK